MSRARKRCASLSAASASQSYDDTQNDEETRGEDDSHTCSSESDSYDDLMVSGEGSELQPTASLSEAGSEGESDSDVDVEEFWQGLALTGKRGLGFRSSKRKKSQESVHQLRSIPPSGEEHRNQRLDGDETSRERKSAASTPTNLEEESATHAETTGSGTGRRKGSERSSSNGSNLDKRDSEVASRKRSKNTRRRRKLGRDDQWQNDSKETSRRVSPDFCRENSAKDVLAIFSEDLLQHTFTSAVLELFACGVSAPKSGKKRSKAPGIPSHVFDACEESVGGLTLTSYEMQVDIDRYKKSGGLRGTVASIPEHGSMNEDFAEEKQETKKDESSKMTTAHSSGSTAVDPVSADKLTSAQVHFDPVSSQTGSDSVGKKTPSPVVSGDGDGLAAEKIVSDQTPAVPSGEIKRATNAEETTDATQEINHKDSNRDPIEEVDEFNMERVEI